jgi:hypothetical protein
MASSSSSAAGSPLSLSGTRRPPLTARTSTARQL